MGDGRFFGTSSPKIIENEVAMISEGQGDAGSGGFADADGTQQRGGQEPGQDRFGEVAGDQGGDGDAQLAPDSWNDRVRCACWT